MYESSIETDLTFWTNNLSQVLQGIYPLDLSGNLAFLRDRNNENFSPHQKVFLLRPFNICRNQSFTKLLPFLQYKIKDGVF